jgi:hypothetical protein
MGSFVEGERMKWTGTAMVATIGLAGAVAWAAMPATTEAPTPGAERYCSLDLDRDGVVSAGEAHAAARSAHATMQYGAHPALTNPHASAVHQFRSADQDGDGALSRAEVEQSLPALAQRFDQYDLDRDGQLDAFEIHHPFMSRPPVRQRQDGVIQRFRQPDAERVFNL